MNDCIDCQFPAHWAGNWFQKGVQDSIRILNSNISDKGICRESNGEKFLIENRYSINSFLHFYHNFQIGLIFKINLN